MAGEEVWVAALGASTPVGRDALSSAAAVRAGISGFAEHPFMVDTAGERMRICRAPWLELDRQGQGRFEALLFPAIDQALAPLERVPSASVRVALAIGVPPPRPGLPRDIEGALRDRVGERFSGRLAGVGTFPIGHASGLVALHAALRRFAEGAFDGCVIAGVDSYLAPETLEWLESNEQLHGAGPLNNAWGFVPGEAAGAVLFLNSSTATRFQMDPLARVVAVGTATEQNRIKTDTVCIGEGLTSALRQALAGLPPGEKVTDIFCDMNGEPYRADEFGFACLRNKEAFLSASDFVAPADCWGDVSAASAPLALTLAAVALRKGYAGGRYPLIWASSEGGERGAALLESSAGARH